MQLRKMNWKGKLNFFIYFNFLLLLCINYVYLFIIFSRKTLISTLIEFNYILAKQDNYMFRK